MAEELIAVAISRRGGSILIRLIDSLGGDIGTDTPLQELREIKKHLIDRGIESAHDVTVSCTAFINQVDPRLGG